MTIPTIAELKGNTILELVENSYNAIKNDMNNKQDTLIAGDNIVISGNVISAIEGGTPVLENYYTKQETDSLLDDKADSGDVYDKEQIDDMLVAIGSEIPDMELYYTKTETDDLLDTKADSNSVYNKTAVDSKLLLKANTTDVYSKSEVYSKVETYNKSEVYNKTETYSKSEVYNKTETYSKSEVDSLIAENYTIFNDEDWGSLFEVPSVEVAGENYPYMAKKDMIVKVLIKTGEGTDVLETAIEFKKGFFYRFYKELSNDSHYSVPAGGFKYVNSVPYFGVSIQIPFHEHTGAYKFINASGTNSVIVLDKAYTYSSYENISTSNGKIILYYKEE